MVKPRSTPEGLGVLATHCHRESPAMIASRLPCVAAPPRVTAPPRVAAPPCVVAPPLLDESLAVGQYHSLLSPTWIAGAFHLRSSKGKCAFSTSRSHRCRHSFMRAEGCTTTTKKGQTGLMNSGPPKSGEFDAGGQVRDIYFSFVARGRERA